LNKALGKGKSTIFLPVDLEGFLDPLESLKSFASVVPVFDALASEDQSLYEYLLDPIGKSYPLRCIGVGLGLESAKEKLAVVEAARKATRHGWKTASERERLLRSERIPWDLGFGELKRLVTECKRYPKTTDGWVLGTALVNFYTFYNYCRDGYKLWRKGKETYLEPHQLRDLESLPYWETYGLKGPYVWRESLKFLEAWLEEHGTPPLLEINMGGFCGLAATPMERLSGALTVVNQSDFAKRVKGELRQGMRLPQRKQDELNRICQKYGVRWKKVLKENGVVDEKKPTFIQESHANFKALWKEAQGGNQKALKYIEDWFPGYPEKHKVQEDPSVPKSVIPPRYKACKKKSSEK